MARLDRIEQSLAATEKSAIATLPSVSADSRTSKIAFSTKVHSPCWTDAIADVIPQNAHVVISRALLDR